MRLLILRPLVRIQPGAPFSLKRDQPMIPRILLGTAIVPGGGEELRLFRRGEDFMIVLDRNELMNSRMSGSEEALATMTIERLGKRDAHLLIGGYGMGFTLRASYDALSAKGKITLVELVPEIVSWAKGFMATLTGRSEEHTSELQSR